MAPAKVTFQLDCARCDVRDAQAAADGKPHTFARVTLHKGTTGSVRLRAQRTDGAFPGGSFGAVVSAKGMLDVRRDVVVRSLNRGAQAATSFGIALAEPPFDTPQQLRVVAQGAYDAIEIVLRRNKDSDKAELRVHEFCGV